MGRNEEVKDNVKNESGKLGIKRNDPMMEGSYCAQCSDTRNIYIKTCDCSKKQVNYLQGLGVKQVTGHQPSTVDTNKTTEDSKIKAVKAVVYKVIRVYETVPTKTMKYAGAVVVLLILVAAFSLALAQNKEETKSQYGIAFPLEDAASINPEQRVAPAGSVPGEGSVQGSTEATPVTTTTSSTEENPATVTATPEDDKKQEDENSDNDQPTFLIASDEDDKPAENGEEQNNPKLVFIERLMGLHLSSPFGQQPGEKEEQENRQENISESAMPIKNPFEKVNAKWASRMRKFSIPIMNQQIQQSEQPNPLLRFAAAAMMTRLLAAAARANHQGQPMMAKDKDDDADDETVPVLLATMRSNGERSDQMRPMPPMYGRPMPRPALMRPPLRSPMAAYQAHQARMASNSAPQRSYSAPMVPQRTGSAMQRPMPPIQPVLIMLAHVPMPAQAESRMGPSISPYYGPQQQMPMYSQGLHSYGYHYMPRPVIPIEVPVPVHVPVHVPVASYQRPIYAQAPYQGNAFHQTQRSSGPAGPMQSAYSHARPVIEVPIEIPIPIHVPVPVSVQSSRDLNTEQDHEASATETDQVAIVYYDPESQDATEQEEQVEPQTAESHETAFRVAPGVKNFAYLSRPFPDNQSPAKMKLWREYINAKHSAQPGVRYVPVAVANDESQAQTGHDSHSQEPSEPAESQAQPAFVILAEEGTEEPLQEHH